MTFAHAIASSVAKATSWGLDTPGAQSPRRSGVVLKVMRTRPPGSLADQLRMRPKGAVISVDSPGTRPSTERKNSVDWSKSSIDSVIDT